MAPSISYYSSAYNAKSSKTIPLDIFLDSIRDGKWQDIVLPIRTVGDKAARSEAKKKVPAVTISGTFKARNDNGIEAHSGYIAIDIDDVDDPEVIKAQLSTDKYVAAAFISISGRGICLLFRINPAKHREAFNGISEYLHDNYKLIADPTSVNPSRMRFISYDPHVYANLAGAEKFTLYPKNKPPKKVDKVLYAQSDFDEIIDQVVSRRLNLCENYHEWIRIAFALAHQFGEAGRHYFHIVSQYSTKYDPTVADRQYSACLKHHALGNQATIATLYYYCKQAGVRIYSERTRKIAYSAASGKKGGLTPKQVSDNLEKFEGITGAADLVQQVMDGDIVIQGEDSLLDQLEMWLRQNYNLRRNVITRYVENNGEPMKQVDFNTIFVSAKKVFDRLSYELMDRVINSRIIEEYNPFLDFIDQHKDMNPSGAIERVFACVRCNDGEYLLHFGRKWLVSIMASIHGEHSPLMLVLCGEEHGTGKTEFYRRLLPRELHLHYYAESKLDAGKDDEIMMTQKLIIMDDEMGGKSKKEAKRLKELTSKQTFSLREPYGRNNVDLNRLAVLCGTTNDQEILNDPTGNRRIIPIHITSIDHAAYNAVDKIELFMEAYHLWKGGFEWRLDRHDIAYLNKDASEFEVTTLESELLTKYFEPAGTNYGCETLTATDIKSFLEMQSGQKLILDRLGKELKRKGFVRKQRRSGNARVWGYDVKRVGGVHNPYNTTPQHQIEDPFPILSQGGTSTSPPFL